MGYYKLVSAALCSTVFICGFAVMSLEIVAARITAPYFGLSISVWSCIIAVILASLSLGSWTGGQVAEKFHNRLILPWCVFVASLWVLLVNSFGDLVAGLLVNGSMHFITGACITICILWAVPSILLGMVGVLSFHAQASAENRSRLFGSITALGNMGSIAGTLACGLIFIPRMSSQTILLSLAGLLCMSAVLLFMLMRKFRIALIAGVVFLIFLVFLPDATRLGIAVRDTPYARIWIEEEKDAQTGWKMRSVRTDPFLVQGRMLIDPAIERTGLHQQSPFDDLYRRFLKDKGQLRYGRFLPLVDSLVPSHKKLLVLGGGAYLLPRTYLGNDSARSVDVVEIDPGMTQVARDFFQLRDDVRMQIYEQDARQFLNWYRGPTYDAVVMDIFNSTSSAPFWVVTKEALASVLNVLSPGGIVLVNIFSAADGKGGALLRAVLKTFKEVFPETMLFRVDPDKEAARPQSFVIVALTEQAAERLHNNSESIAAFRESLYLKELADDVPVLTDAFAPIDRYAEEVVSLLKKRGGHH